MNKSVQKKLVSKDRRTSENMMTREFVESMDDEGSINSSNINIQDLINHVKMSTKKQDPSSSRECNIFQAGISF